MDDFDTWYTAYPRKMAKIEAYRAYIQQRKMGFQAVDLLNGATMYAALVISQKIERQFIPYPASWLRAGRWMDEDLKPILTPEQIAEAKDRADRLMKRGKYSTQQG